MPNKITYEKNKEYYRARAREYAAQKRVADPDGVKAYKRAWAKANRQSSRDRHLKIHYGMTQENYDTMLAAQGGVCAICSGPPNGRGKATGTFHVDHDHATGRVRGLLCSHCNSLLGYSKDSEAVLLKAIAYLRRQRQSCSAGVS